MQEMGDLKKGWRRLPMQFFAIMAGAGLLIGLVFVSGFKPVVVKPATVADKLLALGQRLDGKWFLKPVAMHQGTAAAIGLIALFATGLFGLASKSFKDPEARMKALVLAPLGSLILGGSLITFARWKGLTMDPDPRNPFHAWSWVILSALVAIVANNAYTWLAALRHGPRTLPEMLKQRHYYDIEDLGGTATVRDLKADPSPLLIKFPDCAWPNTEHSEVQRLLRGRLVVGRFYERHTRTNFWVCPEIEKMQQTLVVAPPGAGKTYSIALPWCREIPIQGHSAFVVDVKANMAKKLESHWGESKIRLYTFNPADPEHSIKWNIFEEIDRRDPDALRLGTKLITQAIFGEISHGENQFWDRTEQGFITAGLELLLRSNAEAAPPDLAKLFRSKEALTAQIAQLRALMTEYPERYTSKDHDRFEHIESRLQLLLQDDRQKKFGFNELSQGVKIKLEPFENGHIERVTTGGTFRLAQLTASPSCMVFAAPMSMGDDAASLAAIAFRLLQMLMHRRYSDEEHGQRIFFILDEFSKLRASTHESEVFLSTSREAGCVSVVFLQEVNQLDERTRDALLGDLRDCYILHGAARKTTEWFEGAFGRRRHMRSSVSEQRSASAKHSSDGISLSATEEWVPVLAAREIQKTGGLLHGAWVSYKNYADQKPILVDMKRPST